MMKVSRESDRNGRGYSSHREEPQHAATCREPKLEARLTQRVADEKGQ